MVLERNPRFQALPPLQPVPPLPPLSEEILVRLGIFFTIILLAVIGISEIFVPERLPANLPVTPVTNLPVPVPPQPITPSEIDHGDRSKQQVIFTFDGNESSQSADLMLEILAKHHVKATFFLTGKFVNAFPDVVRKIVAGGHEIFNHSFSHPFFTALSDDEISQQLQKMDQSLFQVAGITAKPYFRPPYGDRNSRVLSAAFKAGYQSVYWSADTRDWQETEGRTAKDVKEYILSHVAPGTIYLMHVGTKITGEILDEVLTSIEGRGYKIVSLTQGL